MESTLDFAKHINNYLNEFLRHADIKASVVFLVSGAMLGYLAQNAGPPQVSEFIVGKTILFWLAVLPDFIALVTGLWIVLPRLPRAPQEGFVFWDDIRVFKNSQDYAAAISTTSEQQQIEAMAQQNYALAGITQRKFRKLQWAIRFAAAGAILTFLFVILY